jgi:hypothetical protein
VFEIGLKSINISSVFILKNMYHPPPPTGVGISTDEFCEENMKRKQEKKKRKGERM